MTWNPSTYGAAHGRLGQPGNPCRSCGRRVDVKRVRLVWGLDHDAPFENLRLQVGGGFDGKVFSVLAADYRPICITCNAAEGEPVELKDRLREAGQLAVVEKRTCTECDQPATRPGVRCTKHYRPAKRYPPDSLTPRETVALLAAARQEPEHGLRNAALISLLIGTGLRIAEALALRPHDIDFDSGSIFVAHGKGDKSRRVAILKRYEPVVREWVEAREAAGFTSGQPVFVSRSGSALDTSYARKLLPRLAREAGIVRRVHPHGLRHTFAAEAARASIRPELIQRQLGHSNLGTTTRYLATISPDEVIDAFRGLE